MKGIGMTTTTFPRPKLGLGYIGTLLAALLLFFVLLLDQGQTLSLIQGQIAYQQLIVHEAVHDARHTAAAPCH
jgi:hypothetical protein